MKKIFLFAATLLGLSQASAQNNLAYRLDSFRLALLKPEVQKFISLANQYCEKIKSLKENDSIVYYSKKLVKLSADFRDEVNGLYGYKTKSTVSPVYVGGTTSAMYPNVGGFIFPVFYYETAQRPSASKLADDINGYAWNIRFFKSEKCIARNIKRIDKKIKALENV